MVSASCRGGREHEDGITSLPIHCHLARFRVFDKKKIEKVTFKDETWKHQKEQDIYKSQHDKSMEISWFEMHITWIVKVFIVHSWEKAVTLMNKIFKKHPIVVPFDQVSNLKDRVLLVKP